jgi:hypothetical protein
MTTLIEFLEKMGSDAQLRGSCGEDLVRAMETAGIDAAAREALLSQDQRDLEELMGASANVFASLEAPEDEGEAPVTPPSTPDDGGKPASAPRKKKGGKKKGGGKKKAPKKPAPKRGGVKKKSSKKKATKKKVSKKKGGGKKKASRKKK